MGTRSVIAIPMDNGFKGRYVHWDGYPSEKVPTLLKLVAERGLEEVRKVLVEEHYSWSNVSYAPVGELPGTPHTDVDADEWFVNDPAELWPHIEWVYILNGSELTVMQPFEREIRHVGGFEWGIEPTETEVREVECGVNYERCKHLAWAHVDEELREEVGRMSMRTWIGAEPLTFRDASGIRVGNSVLKFTGSGGTGTARSDSYRDVMAAGPRAPRYWWAATEGSTRSTRVARILKAGYKSEVDLVMPRTQNRESHIVAKGSLFPSG